MQLKFYVGVRKTELDTSILGKSDKLVCTFQVGPRENLLMYIAGQYGMVTWSMLQKELLLPPTIQ